MTYELEEIVKNFVEHEFQQKIKPVFTRSDKSHGDFSCNIAMQIAGILGANPREIADKIAEELKKQDSLKEISVAGPGFINITLNDAYLVKNLDFNQNKYSVNGLKVLLEYSCPNAFKELHTGHLYQTLIGDSMGRIYEYMGGQVYRTSFGGDVGLHAGKCLYGILEALGGENPDKLAEVKDKSAWISSAYVAGSKAYEKNESTKQQIEELNKRIYQLFASKDETSAFAKIYFTTRQWSYDYFDEFYKSIDAIAFDSYYPESQTMEPGLELVRANIGNIFTESEGATVLDEAKSGLHTRVFITSAGLPTYETKDLGVIQLEKIQYPYDKRIILTGNDQSEYMKVVFAALTLIDPELGAKQRHVANGTVKFADGSKMSSRLGNVSKAVDVVNGVESVITAGTSELKRDIALGAVKYSLLKSRVGGDISFDLEQSISTEGKSGPYLQYALARARSIIKKSSLADRPINDLTEDERKLAVKISAFPEVLEITITDFSPHNICTYIYELAQEFNRFYEKNRVIGDERESQRLSLIQKYEQTLGTALNLLGIPTPEKI